MLKKILFIILILIFTNNSFASIPVTYNGYTIGMPIPPNNFYLSWDNYNSISVEQYVCLIGIEYKGRHHSGYSQSSHYNSKEARVEVGAVSLNTQGSTSNFTLRSDNNDFLKYRIDFLNHKNNSYQNLQNNKLRNNIQGKTYCDSSDSRPQKIRITISHSELKKARAGEYRDMVFLLSAKNGLVYTYDIFYINLTINGGQIQINQLDDVNFGDYQIGMGSLSAEEKFCVYVSPNDSYNINITDGKGSGNTFYLTGSTENIPYKAYFRTTSTNYYAITNGATMGSFTGNEVENCTNQEGYQGGERAYIKLEINENDILNASPQTYKGQIYLTVSPE